MRAALFLPAALCAAVGLAACAASPTMPSQVPESLKPPPGQVLQLEALAAGVQIYDCAAKPDGSGYAWTFRAPEATLADRDGKELGRHYAGPTWEALDGSRVVGEVTARDAGPTPATAIPWLLLAAKGHGGSGVFADTRSIQRLFTGGGVPPAERCTADKAGQVGRVAYTATYYFYR